MKNILYFLPLLFLFFACKKDNSLRILNRTCVTTKHHNLIIGNLDVHIKYDATDFNFPGFEDLAEYDTTFTTNAEGYGCIDNLPTGKHWFVTLGTEAGTNLMVKGTAFVTISFEQPEIDTILYVGEEIEFCR